MAEAQDWIVEYSDPANATRRKPSAHPAYDRYATGSGPSELNDGDLLAPALLNAGPTVRAFYSLQQVRPRLVEALSRIPTDVDLETAIEAGRMQAWLGDLAAVLDDPVRPSGVKLTTLLKVLHRKRPSFIPLYDQFVGACYVGTDDHFPVHRDPRRSWRDYAVAIAEAMGADLSSQREAFSTLHERAPQVTVLRVLDVVAWNLGRRRPSTEAHSAPE